MTKFLSAVVTLITLSASGAALANDGLLAFNLKTKQIVRMKLWYEGLESNQDKTQQNQEVDQVEMSEELERALDKTEF